MQRCLLGILRHASAPTTQQPAQLGRHQTQIHWNPTGSNVADAMAHTSGRATGAHYSGCYRYRRQTQMWQVRASRAHSNREAPSIVRFAISRVAPVSYCLCVSAFRRIDASETSPSFPFAAHGRCFCRRTRHPSFGRRRSFSRCWPAVASAAPRLRVQTLSDLASNHTESNAYRDRAHQAFVLPASIQLRCATEV